MRNISKLSTENYIFISNQRKTTLCGINGRSHCSIYCNLVSGTNWNYCVDILTVLFKSVPSQLSYHFNSYRSEL